MIFSDLTLTNMQIIFVSKDYFVVLTVFTAIYCWFNDSIAFIKLPRHILCHTDQTSTNFPAEGAKNQFTSMSWDIGRHAMRVPFIQRFFWAQDSWGLVLFYAQLLGNVYLENLSRFETHCTEDWSRSKKMMLNIRVMWHTAGQKWEDIKEHVWVLIPACRIWVFCHRSFLSSPNLLGLL